MSKPTISTFDLFKMFPDQEAARTFLEGRLWPEGPKCPVCGLGERITARRRAASAGGRGTRDVCQGGHKAAASEVLGIVRRRSAN